MRDQRIDRWADLLVNYSLGAKKGQTALMVGDPEALPLVSAVFEQFIRAGVLVETCIDVREWSEFLLEHGTDEQLAFTPVGKLSAVQKYDMYIRIGANSNSKMLSQVPPAKQSKLLVGAKPIRDAMLGRAASGDLRWCYTIFPTPSSAQDAEMGTNQFAEFVLQAGFLDEKDPIAVWKEIEQRQSRIVEMLSTKKELHFQNWQGTDLRVNVDGMKWINCCGKINFPDGEVYTGPNLKAADGGVNGVVRYALPTVCKNVEMHDVELTFKQGVVVEAKASKNEAFLREMVALDAGSNTVGEIAFGTNDRIQSCTKEILFDEKIGGTFHLALGCGYPQTGNCNVSALHWDLIFDLRGGGTVHADNELIMKDGVFAY